jgi:hypothetical protein
MNTPEIRSFINKHSDLFWYIPADKKEEISHELMVETIFNYGNLDDIRQLVNILGIKRLTEIYNGINGRKRLNYYPEVFNLFSLIIRKYAH